MDGCTNAPNMFLHRSENLTLLRPFFAQAGEAMALVPADNSWVPQMLQVEETNSWKWHSWLVQPNFGGETDVLIL